MQFNHVLYGKLSTIKKKIKARSSVVSERQYLYQDVSFENRRTRLELTNQAQLQHTVSRTIVQPSEINLLRPC